MSFKSLLNVSLGWNWVEGAVENDRIDFASQLLMSSSSAQADGMWKIKNRTIMPGYDSSYNLMSLDKVVMSWVGEISFQTIKLLLIVNHGGGTLGVGGAVDNPWVGPFGSCTDRLFLPPNSPLLFSNPGTGWSVDSFGCNLKLAAQGGTVTYSMILLGVLTEGYPSA